MACLSLGSGASGGVFSTRGALPAQPIEVVRQRRAGHADGLANLARIHLARVSLQKALEDTQPRLIAQGGHAVSMHCEVCFHISNNIEIISNGK